MPRGQVLKLLSGFRPAPGREDDDRLPPSVLPRVKLGIIARYNPVLSSPDASVRASARKRERKRERESEHLLLRDGTRVHPPGAHLSRRSAGETPRVNFPLVRSRVHLKVEEALETRQAPGMLSGN